jgi:uncharacterized protein YjbJ (UPF0337 family)
MLTSEQFNGRWKEIKGGIRNLWGKITDDEIDQTKGDLTQLSGIVEQRYSETKEEIKNKYDQLMASFDNDTDKDIDPDVSSYHRKPIIDDFDSDPNARH